MARFGRKSQERKSGVSGVTPVGWVICHRRHVGSLSGDAESFSPGVSQFGNFDYFRLYPEVPIRVIRGKNGTSKYFGSCKINLKNVGALEYFVGL